MLQALKLSCLAIVGLLWSWSLSNAEITIAVVGGMDGPFTKIGEEFRQGARGAVEEINENGGLLGETVSYVVRDGKCDPGEAVKIANELVKMEVAMVMGHLCSDASIAASEIYEKNKIIEISPSSTSPQYTERGMKYIFRTIGRDDMQGFVIAEHIIRNFKTKKLGILYDPNGYSKGVAEIAREFLNKGKLKEAFFLEAPNEPYDFKAILDQIVGSYVDVVVYPGLPGPILNFVMQSKKMGVKIRLIGGDAFSGLEMDENNRRMFDGVQFSFPPDPVDDRRNRDITERYKSEGYRPEAFVFYSYAAVQVWGQAVKKAGSLGAEEVSRTLRSEKFDTVLGKINFDEKGDISNPGFVMYFFNKGKRYYIE